MSESVAILPQPGPSVYVRLHESLITFFAEKHVDRVLRARKIANPTLLADISAAFTASIEAEFHSRSITGQPVETNKRQPGCDYAGSPLSKP